MLFIAGRRSWNRSAAASAGAGGGAEKASVGVTWFLVAIFLGILVATAY
ncbi:hypothetical protein [Actinomycetospora succinea]|nr:hypothetical protein [Actinomycetospora succinea]